MTTAPIPQAPPEHGLDSITFSTCKNTFDNLSVLHTATVEQFFGLMEADAARVSSKNCRLVYPATFDESVHPKTGEVGRWRLDEKVAELHFLALDFDDGVEAGGHHDTLSRLPWLHAAFSTWSNGDPDKAPGNENLERFRVFIFLTRPVTAEEWVELMAFLNEERLGGVLGSEAQHPWRGYYTPRRPRPGLEDRWWMTKGVGPVFDPDADCPDLAERIERRRQEREREEREKGEAKRRARHRRPTPGDEDLMARALHALDHIDPDVPYDVWLMVLQAFHSEWSGEDGLAAVLSWSANGSKFKGESEIRYKWGTFKAGGGVTINSMFEEAKRHGWDPRNAPGSRRRRTSKAPPMSASGGSSEPPPRGGGDPPGKPSSGGGGGDEPPDDECTEVERALALLDEQISAVEALDEDDRHDAVTHLMMTLLDGELFEAVVLAVTDAPRQWAILCIRLNSLGIAKTWISRQLEPMASDEAERRARQQIEREAPDDGEPVEVLDLWPDAPVPSGVVMPRGYVVDGGRVLKEVVKPASDGSLDVRRFLVSTCPVIIVGRYWDAATRSESTRIAWRRDGWQSCVVDRATAASNRKVVDLADRGFPVTSSTARDMVEYLAASEAANLAALPRIEVTSQMGWHGTGKFMWGRHLITADGIGNATRLDEIRTGQAPALSFRGADEGDEQLAAGCFSRGELAAWLEMAARLDPHPFAALGIYAALAAPLLEHVGAHNFIVDWSYPTSSGKTTALRAAASVWGDPDEMSPASYVHSWGQTRVWIERASAIYSGLALALDDTKRAKYRSTVAHAIYDVASGRGGGRGSLAGLRSTETWRTVLLSTGEEPATAFSEDGGTRARVLSCWGQVFGAQNEAMGRFAQEIDVQARMNFGHAGPAFVRWLMERSADRERHRECHAELRAVWMKRAAGNAVKGRMAEHFATLELAAELATDALGLTLNYRKHLEHIWTVCSRAAEGADRAEVALGFLASWASAHRAAFIDGPRRSKQWVEPAAGCAGRWDGGLMSFHPYRAKELLEAAKHPDAEALFNLWCERDWLKTSKGREPYHQRQVDDEKPRLLSIRCDVLQQLGFIELAGGASGEGGGAETSADDGAGGGSDDEDVGF